MFKSLTKLFGMTGSPSVEARLCVAGMEPRFAPNELILAGIPALSGTPAAPVGQGRRSAVAATAVMAAAVGSDAAGHWFMSVGG